MSSAAPSAPPATRVAVLERRGKFLVAEPFFGPGPRIAVSRDRRFVDGDLVVVSSPGRGGGGRGRARVARRLGRPEVARDVIEALMVDRGLRRAFDPALEREARRVAASSDDLRGRRDLRSLSTFTIDPTSAQDFDDAISACTQPDGSWRVWVHIADVSAYVTPGSVIDREAYRRATSVYVPSAVEPMLPPQLSNDVCSLVPGRDRLTVTVEMTIRGHEVATTAFYRSVICSDQRLTYEQVDRVFADMERASEPWGDSLVAARRAAGALGSRRAARSAIVVDSAEPEVLFDQDGNVVAIDSVAQTESHRLIEQLMIAANEQVAGRLEDRRVPCLYRVHEPPDPPSVERLIEQLASLGVPTPLVPRGAFTALQSAELVGQASQLISDWAQRTSRSRRALTSLVLRSLKQAYYDQRNRGHAGLQSPSYCHFTSPIRRYPDLICHRALLSTLVGHAAPPEASNLTPAGPWTSTREREAMAIERDADDIARAFLLERLVFTSGADSVFEGEVVGLIGAGAFIAFGSDGSFEGMLHVRRLRGEWWELNEQGTILLGTRGGATIRLGDPISVRVGGIDAPRGRVDLLPAWGDERPDG